MINLTKGQKIDLTKDDASLTRINVGLGWDEVTFGRDVDCDASCILLGENGKAISSNYEECIVYFSNRQLPGIRHSGDNLTGGGEGDDETIEIDLTKVEDRVSKIIVFMNIYKGSERGQNMSSLKNAYIRLYNPKDGNKEICRFELDESKGTAGGLIVGEIYRHNGNWKFGAIGEAVKKADVISQCISQYMK
jgi:stress response protein SCP2